MKRLLLIGLTAAAFGVGYWDLRLASQNIFVFRNNEPMTSWIVVLFGPCSTLPAALLSCFRRKAAGYWLVAGAVISLVAEVADLFAGGAKSFLFSPWMIQGPMLAIGVGMLLLARSDERRMPLRLAGIAGAVLVLPVALYLGVYVSFWGAGFAGNLGEWLGLRDLFIPLGLSVGHSVVVVFILFVGFHGGVGLARIRKRLVHSMRRDGSHTQ